MFAHETYWLGVAVWLVGFFLYLYGAHWRRSFAAVRIGSAMCWIGFAATAYPVLYGHQVPPFRWPPSINLRHLTAEQIQNAIWIGWLLGFAILIASWVRLVPNYIGWIGFTIGMAATVASWTEDPRLLTAIPVVALLLVLLLIGSRSSGSKRSSRPGDYEAELLRLCYGDTRVASRLIKHELGRHPGFSRQAAAMAASTRLKHDRQ